MTDEKIIKALKELLETALYNGDLQSAETISKALDLINRLQTENKQLRVKLDDYERDIVPKLKYSLERANKYGAETDAENIRLLKENERYAELEQGCYVTGYKNIRAEAIKDFAEIILSDYPEMEYYLNTLVKEMIGEQE